jgi:hypothetical protein
MYSDDFVAALSAAATGINISSDVVPTQDAVESDLTQLQNWLNSLDDDTHQAIDLVTADNPIKAGLADPNVGIVTSIGPILSAYDNLAASLSISMVYTQLANADTQAAAANTPNA